MDTHTISTSSSRFWKYPCSHKTDTVATALVQSLMKPTPHYPQWRIPRIGSHLLAIAYAGFSLVAGSASAPAAESKPSGGKVVQERTERVTTEVKTVTLEAETPPSKARRTAIFVENRAGAAFNDRILFFEDQVSSQLSGKDFAVISREEVLKAKKVYPTEFGGDLVSVRTSVQAASATAVTPLAAAEATASKVTQEIKVARPADQNEAANRNSLGTSQDRLMSDNASATRLAQLMGAEFILFVNIGSYGKESTTVNRPDLDLKLRNTTHTIRGTYKLVEGYEGGGVGGGTFKVAKGFRQTESVQVESDDLANELIEQAATKVVTEMLAKAESFERPAKPNKVDVHIAAYVKDLAGNEVSLPDLRLTEGKVDGEPARWPALVSANVEIDGVMMGTAPASIKVFPGVHKIRLTRPGFQTFDSYFLAEAGTTLEPSLWMDEGGFRRWREIREFLNALDKDRVLTKAKASVLEGYAQMLRQSGFLISAKSESKQESKSDLKVDTKQAPVYNFVRGLWDYWRGY